MITEYLAKAKDQTKVIATRHCFERMRQRKGDLKKFATALLESYEECPPFFSKLAKKSDGEFFFYVRDENQGAVITYRPDKKGGKSKPHFVIITVYPFGVPEPNKRSTPLVVY